MSGNRVGKEIILFATSDESGWGNTVKELRCSVADSTVIEEGTVNGK